MCLNYRIFLLFISFPIRPSTHSYMFWILRFRTSELPNFSFIKKKAISFTSVKLEMFVHYVWNRGQKQLCFTLLFLRTSQFFYSNLLNIGRPCQNMRLSIGNSLKIYVSCKVSYTVHVGIIYISEALHHILYGALYKYNYFPHY